MQKKIFLLGLRACGKSTLGRYLASRHNLEFVDTDELCRLAAGMTIAELVEKQGWPAFRELESGVLRDLPQPAAALPPGTASTSAGPGTSGSPGISGESSTPGRSGESGAPGGNAQKKALVIATGGGIVLDDQNRRLIKNSGFGIYLEAGADLLHARLTANPSTGHRPPLSDSPLLEEIRDNLAAREALYRECARLTVPAGLDVDQLAQRIAEAVDL